MINLSSLAAQQRTLMLNTGKTPEKTPENPTEKEPEKKETPEQKTVQTSANEVLAQQNSAFIITTRNTNQPAIPEKTEESDADSSNGQNKSEKETSEGTNTGTKKPTENFFLTSRSINLDDVVPTPKTTSGLTAGSTGEVVNNETETPETRGAGEIVSGAADAAAAAGGAAKSLTTGGKIVVGGTKLANELTSVLSTFDMSAMPSELANGINEFASLLKNQEQYNTVLETYADYWMQKNNVSEITTGNVKELMTSFLGEEFGLTVANLGKMVGGAALLSVASQIVINSAVERFPEMGKNAVQWGKDFYGNLFKGKIGKAAKTLFVDTPKYLYNGIVKGVKSLATNAYKTVTGIVKPIVTGVVDGVVTLGKGAYDTVKTAVTGIYDAGKTLVTGVVDSGKKVVNGVIDGGKDIVNGFKNAGSKLKKGNVFGAIGSVVGGVAKGAFSIVKGAVTGVVSAVATVGKTVGKVVKTVAKTVGKAVKTVCKTVGKVVKGIGKGIGKIFKGW